MFSSNQKQDLLISTQSYHFDRFLLIVRAGVVFLTSSWVLCTPNAGWNLLFKIFWWKKCKKEEKKEIWWKILQQNGNFKLAPKHLTRVLVQKKLPHFAPNLLTFCIFFCFLAQKILKIKISTSAWSAQHPKACQNIQQWWDITAEMVPIQEAKKLFFVAKKLLLAGKSLYR